jgi:dienelactone hydrolase
MKTNYLINGLLISFAVINITSPANSTIPSRSIIEEVVTYVSDGVSLKGLIDYDRNIKGKRPAVIVVHEWWGLKDHTKMRARKLAEMGYIAMAAILVCHGGSDKFVPMEDYNSLKNKLDSTGADNTFKIYPGATHAFTNPDATENGKKFTMPIEYNQKADTDSWNDMKEFLTRIFKN